MHLVSGIDPGIEELNKYLILTPLLKNRTKPTIKCLLKDLVPIYLALLSSEASYIAFGKFFLTALLPTTGEPFCGPYPHITSASSKDSQLYGTALYSGSS